MRIRGQRGFTLMELMVVIVIVAILAAVAVPLYINYVKDAQRTEAKGAIGAIASAQEVYYQRSYLQGTGTPTYAVDLAALEASNAVDPLEEAKRNWDFTVTGGTGSYTVQACGKTGKPSAGLGVQFTYTRGAAGGGSWTENPCP